LTPAQFTDGVKGEEHREASREGHEEWDKLVVGKDTRLVAVRGGGEEMLGREEWEAGEIRRRWRPFGVADGRRRRSGGAPSA
jgi:hypothetical protein